MNTGAQGSDLAAQFRALLNRVNLDVPDSGRLRWMLTALGLAVWLSIVLALSNQIDAESGRRRAVSADIARFTAISRDNTWESRAQQARALRVQLEGRLWTAATPGLAEAGFESWLRDLLQRRGIEVQQIQIARVPLTTDSNPSAAPNALTGLERMTAKVISSFKSRGLVEAAADISEYDRVLMIDRLIIRTGRNARMEMDVSTIIRLPQ